MKIDVNQIPAEGLTLAEELTPSELDLETDTSKFRSPIKVKADVYRISNVVNVNLTWNALMHASCSRCLNEFEIDFKKNNIELNYPVNPAPAGRSGVNKSEPVIDASTSLSVNGERSRTIDLNPDIRGEIILDYPMKPLCSPDCKGLCPKCGKNLNQGGCSCGTT